MNNIVFQINIKGPRVKKEFELSNLSWSNWCKKRNYKYFVLTEEIYNLQYMNANWHKFYCIKLLENENIKYDQIAIVDSDTIVHPDCPDFFKETEYKFSAVQNDGCYEWVNRSIKKYKSCLFNEIEINPWNYFNSGFIIINKRHKQFVKNLYDFYEKNRDIIVNAQETFKVGTDQTPINYLTRKHKIDLKFLSNKYNLQDLHRKSLLYLSPDMWFDDKLHFLNSGWIYHFNAIPPNPMQRDCGYWMKRTYKELYK